MNLDPASAERNLHHEGYYRSPDELYDDLLGRGKGDPDMYGYPCELPTTTHSAPRIEGDTATIDWSSKVPF